MAHQVQSVRAKEKTAAESPFSHHSNKAENLEKQEES